MSASDLRAKVTDTLFTILGIAIFASILWFIWLSSQPGSSVDPMIEVEQEAEQREKEMRAEHYRIEQEDRNRIMRENLEY